MARLELAAHPPPGREHLEVVDAVVVYLLAIDDHHVVTFDEPTDKHVCGRDVLVSVATVGRPEVPATRVHHPAGYAGTALRRARCRA
jgi:hypothetical protein